MLYHQHPVHPSDQPHFRPWIQTLPCFSAPLRLQMPFGSEFIPRNTSPAYFTLMVVFVERFKPERWRLKPFIRGDSTVTLAFVASLVKVRPDLRTVVKGKSGRSRITPIRKGGIAWGQLNPIVLRESVTPPLDYGACAVHRQCRIDGFELLLSAVD